MVADGLQDLVDASFSHRPPAEILPQRRGGAEET
jgi:hypothetical protein